MRNIVFSSIFKNKYIFFIAYMFYNISKYSPVMFVWFPKHKYEIKRACFSDYINKEISLSLSQLMCSSMQKVLVEEEERVAQLQELVAELERKNKQLRQRVGKLRHSLRKTRRASRRAERERLSVTERHVGHHLNAIPPRHRYTHGLWA